MTPAESYSFALLPDPDYCCGLALRPLSIGHMLLMRRLGLSFFFEDREDQLQDLLTGVLICSGTFSEFVPALYRPEGLSVVCGLQRRLSGGFRGKVSRTFRRLIGREVEVEEIVGIDFQAERGRFRAYLEKFGAWRTEQTPDWAIPSLAINQKQGTADPSGVPEYIELLDALTAELAVPLAEALETSLPLARWRWATYLARKGVAKIVDLDFVRKMKAEADEFAAKAYVDNH